MAKISPLKDLENRKRALVAESEVYRQTLTLEIQNLRLYGVRMQKKLVILRLANPLFLFGASLVGSRFFGRRRSDRRPRGKWTRLFGVGLMGWRLFRQFGPLLQRVLIRPPGRGRTAAEKRGEGQAPAANI